ncbi:MULTISPECIES: helix-turn-helix domain-containing protein [Auritidibacter]|uniref:Helix-turn-helix domain-containing protein n=1 Tax=Auritidibacter ignavus TaxID=678932 RepID=A0AAJ6ANJ1_9MICC|nr:MULTISPECIES: helix-turn-helix domain-containing protein [Auritidibacter]PXA76120.1 DNA-binding protein [Auritidibacter sp. NML120779]AXR73176.1 DNA-binding protein [Auritidibacter sp. NML130574]NIH71632.1 excisionase family DNA binding protein [Auritidibacter ignavus]PXA77454.1 DNA-binding protein [Auritidibacter sp. NML100628]PXA81931.1 DNA-binding protein [Auritidibacter sp. NML120636]
MPRFLTLPDVAEELQISVGAARNLVQSGELEAFQIGGRGQWRVDSERFEAFIQRLHDEQHAKIEEQKSAHQN